MSRFARHADGNQTVIVAALRQVGALVQHLHTVGGGCPDLLVGFRKRLVLLEVKDPTQKPSDRKLNEAEQKFHALWKAAGLPVFVVENVEQALEAIGLAGKEGA